MLHKTFFTVLLLLLPIVCLYSQQIEFAGRFEFGGNITYKSSTVEQPNSVNQEPVTVIYSDKTYTVMPVFGYYITNHIEIVLEPRYSYRKQKTDAPFLIYRNESQTSTLYQPGVSIGAYFQYPLMERIIPFAGCRVGWNWRKSKVEWGTYVLPSLFEEWTKPEVSFPSIAGGVKAYVTEHWSIVVQAQYSEITNWGGHHGVNDTDTDFFVGFAVVL